MHNDWIRERATSFVSCVPNSPLTDSEQAAVDRIVGEAQVVAIGEATHGSKEIVQARERVLRFLIQDRKAAIVVLESCFAATQPLNRYVMDGDGTAREAIVATACWSCANHETLGFVTWLRDFNRALPGATRPVRIFGCDVQSIDGPKTELARLLQHFRSTSQLSPETIAETAVLLADLPTDRDLFRFVELLVSEGTSNNPDETRIADIQARQAAFMAASRASAEKVSRRLREVQQALPSTVQDDDRFVFERCRRLLEQVIEFYSPGGLEKRDLFMAENVTALRQQFPRERLLLLSHNLHVARVPLTIRGQPFVPMGCLLARQFGGDYRAIGSAFYDGKYLAVAGDGPEQDQIVVAHTPDLRSFEYILQSVANDQQTPGLLLDLSRRAPHESAFPWQRGLEMRTGEAGNQGSYESSFTRQRPELQYDGMIFLKETSPITVLPGYYQHASEKWKPTEAVNDDHELAILHNRQKFL
jgi:erythromycin esterase